MKLNNIKWLTGSLMTAVLAAGISACSDDHFDLVDHYSSTGDIRGTRTLWQNIQADEELSDFADILKRVYYSKSENQTTTQTYADLLNGQQTFTVWAPKNGTFDYDYYTRLLDTGDRESIYKVEQEFIRNHMTRYRKAYTGSGTADITLFNGKTVTLDYDNQTIKGAEIDPANVNQGATNGVFHIMDEPVPFLPNLYEYLASRDDLSEINAFIKSFEKIEFSEAASTPGPTINGVQTWVDSVTYLSNSYLSDFMNAYLNHEDSSYAMIIPTNDAWNNTLAITKKYYNFKNHYQQDVHIQTEAGEDSLIEGKATDFTEAELDSIVNFYSKNAICQHLAYNAKWQYEQKPISTIAEINASDSLHTTTGVKFKKTGTLDLNQLRGTVMEVDDYGTLFGNADPEEVSNGYAYVVDPLEYPRIYAPNTYGINYEYCKNGCVMAYGRESYEKGYFYPVTVEEDGNTTTELVELDSTYNYFYYKMRPQNPNSSNPEAYFKLLNVLSCKYDIYVVIGYNTEADRPNSFYADITYDDANGKRVKEEHLLNPNEDAVDAKGKNLKGDRHFVNRPTRYNSDGKICFTDTILLAKDFEFPYCYYGLSNDAYPTIHIQNHFTTADRNRYSREIWVNSFILKPKKWTASDIEQIEE